MKRTEHFIFPVIFLAALLLTFLGSCAAKPETALLGTWQGPGGGESISFLKDGTFRGVLIWDMTQAPIEVRGTYKVKGDSLMLTPERKTHDLEQMTCRIAFSNGGKELTMTFVQGGSIKRDGSLTHYLKAA